MTDDLLVLGSSSPRRHALLSQLDVLFEIAIANINEDILVGESPTDYILRMVDKKAESIVQSLDFSTFPVSANHCVILTCDTIGVMPNQQDILIKPVDEADAFNMWRKMSGKHHHVWTAVQATKVKLDTTSTSAQIVWQKQILEKTKVVFTELTEKDMRQYWQTGEPLDKAGGYAIQGKAARWVSRIEGSYTNVVGLPLAQTKQLLLEANQA